MAMNFFAKRAGLKSWARRMASPGIVFWTLPWLMVLLIIGTVAQKDLGLYKAHSLYFSSWILWAGPIPLPGTYATLTVITLSLLLKFLFFSEWSRARAGTILTHLGILVLLIGGMLTALTQEEGYIALKEGGSGSVVSDYHDRIVRVEKDGARLADIPFYDLDVGRPLPGLSFTATVQMTCRNCAAAPPLQDAANGNKRRGLASEISLVAAAPEKEDEANLSGLMFRVEGASAEADGLYLTMEDIPEIPQITTAQGTYKVRIMRAERVLPFTLTLKDFTRDMHPGTNVARGFSSDVVVGENGVIWPAHIRMNEPLRYKGYTIYQASYAIRPDGDVSIFSVVENKGRIFPYAASFLVFAGLLLHLAIRMRQYGKAHGRAA
jgi:hypothetical protein